MEQYNASVMEKTIDDLCVEFPHCNISSNAALPQKVKIIVARAKDLEDTIENMDAKHKVHIAELEARTLGTPLTIREAWVQDLRGYAEMVETHIAEAQQLLNDASQAWTNMDDINGLVEVRAALQKMQREIDGLIGTMKDLLLIERMLKMGKMTKLQAEMQKLRAEEACYTKTLQPWQEKVSAIVVGVNEKLLQARRMHTIVTSLLEEQPTADLVNATRERIDQITQEIAELCTNFNKMNNEMWDIVHPLKAGACGSGMSHK